MIEEENEKPKLERFAGFDVHPIASLYPMMTKADKDGAPLIDNVMIRGVLVPVVLDQHNRIVDGRNRAKSYELAFSDSREFREKYPDLPTVQKTFADSREIFLFIRAMNEYRRHMEPGQAAAITVKAIDMIKAESAENAKATQFKPGESGNPTGKTPKEQADMISYPPAPSRDIKEKNENSTIGKVAELGNMSYYQAAKAVKVRKECPEALDLAAKGEIDLGQAVKALEVDPGLLKARIENKITNEAFKEALKPPPKPKAPAVKARLPKAQPVPASEGTTMVKIPMPGGQYKEMDYADLDADDRSICIFTFKRLGKAAQVELGKMFVSLVNGDSGL